LAVVSVDNRPANRQAHPHALGLCGEKRIKNPLMGATLQRRLMLIEFMIRELDLAAR
jgi:hypothetical protein